MTDTPAPSTDIVAGFGDDLDPATKRHLAAMHREARQLALTSVVPKSITHRREKVGNDWQDVAVPHGEIVATLFAVVRYGELFGFPPAVALSKVDVIEGRLEPRYDALLGMVLAAGHSTRWVEQSRERAEIKVRRAEDADDPDGWQHFTFTEEDAIAAGSIKPEPTEAGKKAAWAKSAWQTRRIDMLASKAVKRMVRMSCPDVLISREAEDVLEGVPVDAFARDAQVVDGEPVE